MRCPYSNCQKDYNDDWPTIYNDWLNLQGSSLSIYDRSFYNRLYITCRKCRFCNQLFYDIKAGHENFENAALSFREKDPVLDNLVTFPISKIKFESKKIPKEILNSFNEAERCRSVGSLTGAGGCLRKSIYQLCDIKKVNGADYREKISKLPVKDTYIELLKQIKWLGDNTIKPGEEKYNMEMLDSALEIFPIILDDLYFKDEKMEIASRLLAKARSANTEK